MRPVKDVRLFFALWPDDEVRLKIANNLDRFNLNQNKSRLVTNSNLHLTLHFVGNTSIADYSGFFKKPKVLWLGCQQAPRALYNLHQNLGQKIAQCAFEPEMRAYAPHVTVARKIIEAPASIPFEPVHWQVNRFVLVESISIPGGVRYEVVESYPLVFAL